MYALVTGASSGIGREIAILLAQKGYNLIIVARRLDRLNQIKQQLESRYPIKVKPLSFDLSQTENCYTLYEACKKYPITVLINAAGFGKVGFSPDIPLDSELSMIDTNITSLHVLTKLFLRTMKKGRILNIASMAGFQPAPMLATYSATKAYVVNLSLGINYELKRYKRPIHISTLCPGPVSTEFDLVAGTNFSLRSISAKACAKEAVDGLFKNKNLIIPGIDMKLIHSVSKFIPNWIMLPLQYHIQTKKLF